MKLKWKPGHFEGVEVALDGRFAYYITDDSYLMTEHGQKVDSARVQSREAARTICQRNHDDHHGKGARKSLAQLEAEIAQQEAAGVDYAATWRELKKAVLKAYLLGNLVPKDQHDSELRKLMPMVLSVLSTHTHGMLAGQIRKAME